MSQNGTLLSLVDVHFFCFSKRNEPKKGPTVKKIAIGLCLGKSRVVGWKKDNPDLSGFAPFPVYPRTI
jgi:hypothetical protein